MASLAEVVALLLMSHTQPGVWWTQAAAMRTALRFRRPNVVARSADHVAAAWHRAWPPRNVVAGAADQRAVALTGTTHRNWQKI
jgi:hypothetical protein